MSKSQKIIKESKSFKGLKNLQRLLVQKNIYQSTNSLSSGYEELELLLKLWQFFELFLLGPETLSILQTITNKAKLVELLMLCRIFLEKPEKFSSWRHSSHLPAITNNLSSLKFLSAQRISSLRYFSSRIYSGYFDIKITQELVVYVALPLFQFWRCAPKENI